MKPGDYHVKVPLLLNNEKLKPYTHIELNGELESSSIVFDPPYISMNAVPLETSVDATLKIIGKGFKK